MAFNLARIASTASRPASDSWAVSTAVALLAGLPVQLSLGLRDFS
jgi:hypothetical protein